MDSDSCGHSLKGKNTMLTFMRKHLREALNPREREKVLKHFGLAGKRPRLWGSQINFIKFGSYLDTQRKQGSLSWLQGRGNLICKLLTAEEQTLGQRARGPYLCILRVH